MGKDRVSAASARQVCLASAAGHSYLFRIYYIGTGTDMRVARWGNSLAVRLPKAVAEQAQLQEGVAIDIAVIDGCVTIQRRPPAYSLDELVEQVTPDNRHDETDWGEPQGAEVW